MQQRQKYYFKLFPRWLLPVLFLSEGTGFNFSWSTKNNQLTLAIWQIQKSRLFHIYQL